MDEKIEYKTIDSMCTFSCGKNSGKVIFRGSSSDAGLKN